MRLSSRRSATDQLSPAQRAVVWQAASLLLDYPDMSLVERLPMLRAALDTVEPRLREPLLDGLSGLEARPLPLLQQDYVETFDTHRRCTLYLTYFSHGDTRRRGVALLRFKQTYLRSGFLLDDSELPDHLCVVLEYAATVDAELGGRLLLDHRAGLELLRLSLRDHGSVWAPVVEAVCLTLPPLRGDERDAVRRLAEEGPPAEEVGLTPYGTPAFDAALHDPAHTSAAQPQRADLPMPTFPGGAR